MPRVSIEMFAGRTVEQKRTLVKEVTQAVVSSIGVKAEAVTVVINEMQDQNYGCAGQLRCDTKRG